MNSNVIFFLLASLLVCVAVAAEYDQGFTAKCVSQEVHRYDSQVVYNDKISQRWSDDEECCSHTFVYRGGKAISVDGEDIPIAAKTDDGYLVAIDITNVGWEAGVWSYAISTEMKSIVATEAKSFGLTPALRARAVQYICEFIIH